MLEDCEGDQPLLDVSFPDISVDGEGATLVIYDDSGNSPNGPWMKLSMWQSMDSPDYPSKANQPKVMQPERKDFSSNCYVQTYCIMKSDDGEGEREVMFRFGSWLYSGRIEFLPKISLEDIPYVISALRLQQCKLDYVSDVSCLPTSSPFCPPLEYAASTSIYMENEAVGSEAFLRNLITKFSNERLIKKERHWLEDAGKSFFEFTCVHDVAIESVELIATKKCNAGVISISLYYGGNFYLVVDEGNDNALLDSKFPDISVKGNGYQIQCYPVGLSKWPQLRKMTIWHISTEPSVNPVCQGVIAESFEKVTGENSSLEGQPKRNDNNVNGSEPSKCSVVLPEQNHHITVISDVKECDNEELSPPIQCDNESNGTHKCHDITVKEDETNQLGMNFGASAAETENKEGVENRSQCVEKENGQDCNGPSCVPPEASTNNVDDFRTKHPETQFGRKRVMSNRLKKIAE